MRVSPCTVMVLGSIRARGGAGVAGNEGKGWISGWSSEGAAGASADDNVRAGLDDISGLSRSPAALSPPEGVQWTPK